MAVSTIKGQGNYPLTQVITNYGIAISFKKVNGVRFLFVQGDPSGQIGTGGHTINLADTIVESPELYMEETEAVSSSNFYKIRFYKDKRVQIQPVSGTNAYVNATFVY